MSSISRIKKAAESIGLPQFQVNPAPRSQDAFGLEGFVLKAGRFEVPISGRLARGSVASLEALILNCLLDQGATLAYQVPPAEAEPEVPLLYRDINEAALCGLSDGEAKAILDRAMSEEIITERQARTITTNRAKWILANVKPEPTEEGSPLEALDRQRRALEVAIGYGEVPVSIAGHPEILATHRTALDRDDLVARILAAGFRVAEGQSAINAAAAHYRYAVKDTKPGAFVRVENI